MEELEKVMVRSLEGQSDVKKLSKGGIRNMYKAFRIWHKGKIIKSMSIFTNKFDFRISLYKLNSYVWRFDIFGLEFTWRII